MFDEQSETPSKKWFLKLWARSGDRILTHFQALPEMATYWDDPSELVFNPRLEAMISELVPASPWARQVAQLRCLRGIDTLSAVGLCAEIGDFAASSTRAS